MREPTDDEIFQTAVKIMRMQAACIEWGATPKRSAELVDIDIRDLFGLRQRFAKDHEGEIS